MITTIRQYLWFYLVTAIVFLRSDRAKRYGALLFMALSAAIFSTLSTFHVSGWMFVGTLWPNLSQDTGLLWLALILFRKGEILGRRYPLV